MRKIGVFPGSFDPFTKGHEVIVNKGIDLFDEIVIGIGVNSAKNYMYNIHVCIEFSCVMLRGRSCSHCKQRAMREKRACIMQGEKSSSVCPVIRHRSVPGARIPT